MKFRSHYGIWAAILESARESKGIWKLMYDAQTSHTEMKKLLPELKMSGLIQKSRNGNYLITAKGLTFLELIEQLKALCPDVI